MNKAELLEALEDSHQEMVDLLEDLPDEIMLEPGVIGSWSIKDTLAHLSFWEGQIVTLLFQVKQGVSKPSTAHFGKETVDQVNQRFAETSQQRTLDQIWQDWNGVRKQTIRRVSEFGDAELSNPKLFPWQRDMPLWEWILNDSAGHEEEHGDAIVDWLEKRDSRNNDSNGSGPVNDGSKNDEP